MEHSTSTDFLDELRGDMIYPFSFVFTDGGDEGGDISDIDDGGDDEGGGDGNDNDSDAGDSDDDFLNELLLEIDDDDDSGDSDKDTKDKKDKDKKKAAKDTKNFDSLTSELTDLKSQVSKLWDDKNKLNTALHQARQKTKGKDDSKDDTILSDDQILKIMKDNKDDPKTMLDVVKHLARTEAEKTSGKVVTDAAMKGKKSDLDTQLYTMYPALKDDSSKLRGIVDSTVDFYNLSDHPCGEAAAMGIHLLGVLPDLLKSAEEKGLKGRKSADANKNRKDDINNNKRHGDKGDHGNKKGSLTETQVETSGQLNLTKSQKKIFGSLSGKKGPTSVSVNE